MNALDERTISAPHDGIIVEVLHDAGEYVAATQPAIVRILDTSKLRARFLLSDEMAQKFRERKTANVRLISGVVVSAEIEFIAPIATENITQMTILIDNSNDDIRSSACDLIRP
jgi:multidrug efflux pump subunit AcrA (membrane-fusion protein)